VAVISATYVTAGGQTSVIMTDLFQGVMLLFTGALILYLGIDYLGGFGAFWENLPRGHRTAFPNFNEDPGFPSVGIFWQDGIANTAMFYFLNQGMVMRFLAANSLRESRKAAVGMVVILMVVAACVVGGGGWIARAMVNHGDLPNTVEASQAFYVATELLSSPGVFGLVLAALTAALMSTVDTLITAVGSSGRERCLQALHPPSGHRSADDESSPGHVGFGDGFWGCSRASLHDV
jgi:Na+/proline symporter